MQITADFCGVKFHEIQIFEKEQEGHSNGFWKKTREVREEEEEVWVVTCVRDVSKSPYNLPGMETGDERSTTTYLSTQHKNTGQLE